MLRKTLHRRMRCREFHARLSAPRGEGKRGALLRRVVLYPDGAAQADAGARLERTGGVRIAGAEQIERERSLEPVLIGRNAHVELAFLDAQAVALVTGVVACPMAADAESAAVGR